MVHGFDSNEEYIDKSQELLEKLDKKDLWNKDTLVIGLDKSVRPLAHTMRELSKLEKRETPEIRFLNYSIYDSSSKDFNKISSYLKSKISPEKFSKYKKIVILDDHLYSGTTIKNVKEILKNYFSGSKNKPKIFPAVLNMAFESNINKKLIFANVGGISARAYSQDVGIDDKINSPIQESERQLDKEDRRNFVRTRKQLNKDIEKYVAQKRESKEKDKPISLEKITKSLSLVLLVSGIFISIPRITGNVIGNLPVSNIIGIVLVVLGILGLVFSKKLKN